MKASGDYGGLSIQTDRPMDAGDCIDEAERQIEEYLARRQEYAVLCREEALLEASRCVVKEAAILRLMAMTNPLSGEKNKVHSASSAEAVVETDLQYSTHLSAQREVVFGKNMAHALAEAAHLRAELAISRYKAEAAVR